MIALEADFPDIADDLKTAAINDSALAEALEDYREACERSEDEHSSAKHRAEWASVRKELAQEIRRLFDHRKK